MLVARAPVVVVVVQLLLRLLLPTPWLRRCVLMTKWAMGERRSGRRGFYTANQISMGARRPRQAGDVLERSTVATQAQVVKGSGQETGSGLHGRVMAQEQHSTCGRRKRQPGIWG